MNYEREFEIFRAVIDIENLFNDLEELMAINLGEMTRTVSTGIDAAKKLADLALQTKNIELQEGIISLREQLITIKESLLEAREEILSLKEENSLLKEKIKTLENGPSEKLVVKNGMYYRPNGDGPFCTGCYDSKQQAILLTDIADSFLPLGTHKCPICKNYAGKI
jgi:cell division protein FtsB